MVIQKVKKGLLKDNVFLKYLKRKAGQNAQLLSNLHGSAQKLLLRGQTTINDKL